MSLALMSRASASRSTTFSAPAREDSRTTRMDAMLSAYSVALRNCLPAMLETTSLASQLCASAAPGRLREMANAAAISVFMADSRDGRDQESMAGWQNPASDPAHPGRCVKGVALSEDSGCLVQRRFGT